MAWGFLGECGFFLLFWADKHHLHQIGLPRERPHFPLRLPRARLGLLSSDSQGKALSVSTPPHSQFLQVSCGLPRPSYPHPCHASPISQCPSKTFGTFSSTKDFPDDVIQFARNHPLMYNSVLPMGGRPLFLQVGAGYTFTQITADRVAAADGHYDVLFIGTGQCPPMTTHKTQSGLWPVSGSCPCPVSSPHLCLGYAPIPFWMLPLLFQPTFFTHPTTCSG